MFQGATEFHTASGYGYIICDRRGDRSILVRKEPIYINGRAVDMYMATYSDYRGEHYCYCEQSISDLLEYICWFWEID